MESKNNNRLINSPLSKVALYFFIGLIVVYISYLVSVKNFLLFHVSAELFSVIISAALFMIVWNTRDKNDNPNLVYLGIAYLFVGILDLLHTISYKGMNIYRDYNFYANQVWIAARYLESISLLIFTGFIYKGRKFSYSLIVAIYFAITIIAYLSIFVFKVFPVCFIENIGQTSFKIISEYIIISIVILNIVLISLNRSIYNVKVFIYMVTSLILTVFSEFSFTLYISNYGLSNVIGHILKIFSFFFIYKALIETGLKSPYNLIFSKLKASEQRLKELNESKDKFFSIIAHDLKNPLSGVIGFMDIILKNYGELDDKEKIGYLEMIRNTSKSTLELLDNLLLWARSQTGRITYRPGTISIKGLVFNVIEFLQIMLDKKRITIETIIDDDLTCYGDENMLDTVIRNLISNAIKFSYMDSKIVVSAHQLNGQIKISVKDSGVGMSDEICRRLFKLDSIVTTKGTNEESGSGIGLILAHEFVEKHNGAIEVESKPGTGTTFTVVIPG